MPDRRRHEAVQEAAQEFTSTGLAGDNTGKTGQTEKNLTPRFIDGGCEVVRTVKKKNTRVQKQDSEWWGD